MERGVEEATGARSHSTEETTEVGRSGGGYVVGNAWEGLEIDERGQDFYQTISEMFWY